MEAFLAVVFILAFIFACALAYKKRSAIAKWLNDPSMAMQSDPKTRRKLLARRIEDAKDELALMDEMEDKKQADK